MKPAPMNKDKRSEAALLYRSWYKTPEWQAIRRQRFAMEPHCRFCREAGRMIRALSCDHIKPHRGDPRLFFNLGNTQSLCGPCHDSTKQREERLGYSTKIGPDGLPTDRKHPFNK